MSRLERAFQAYFQNLETSGGTDREGLLREHEDLRDLLEPMLAERAAEAELPATERILGDFRIVREIGRGGMGVVYEAEQLSLDRSVALKVLPGDGMLQPGSLARFRREAMTAGSLSHEGIVKVHGVGSEGGTHWFVMELVEGAPLDKVIDALRDAPWESLHGRSIEDAVRRCKHTPASRGATSGAAPDAAAWSRGYVETVVGIAAQVADALDHAHRAGIVHRDVKPSNVLVRPDGRAVLTDFGIARQQGLPGVTQSGGLTGTPYYVSPEQSLGDDVGVPSDVFSLGVTLYEMLARRRPFEGNTVQQVLARVQTQDPPLPSKANPLPEDLVAVVLKALEKEPEQRYPTAAAFAADLRAFIAYRPVLARRASRVARLRRWLRREPLKATLAAVLLLAVPLVAGMGAWVLLTRAAAATGRERLLHDRIERAVADGFFELYRQGDVQPSVAAFAQALELTPGNAEALAGTAIAWSRSGEHEKALAVLDPTAVERHPSLKRVRAQVLRTAGRESEAADTERGLSEPDEPLDLFLAGEQELYRSRKRDDREGGRRALDLLSRAMLMTREARPLLYYVRSLAAKAAGDEAAARSGAAAMQRLWPDDDRTWYLIGNALAECDPEAAAAALRRYVEKRPDSWPAFANLASCLERINDPEGAIAACRKAASLAPGEAAVHVKLGMILAQAGRLDEAEEVLRRSLTLDPRSANAHLNLGSVLKIREDYDGALASYERALAVDPEVPAVHRAIGNVHLELDRFELAIASYQRAVELSPGYGEAWYALGVARAMNGQGALAVAAWERLIEVEPAAVEQVRDALNSVFEGPEKPRPVLEFLRRLEARESTTAASRPAASRSSAGKYR